MSTGLNPIIQVFMEAVQQGRAQAQAIQQNKLEQEKMKQDREIHKESLDVQKAIHEADIAMRIGEHKDTIAQRTLENFAKGYMRPSGTLRGLADVLPATPETQPGDKVPYAPTPPVVTRQQFQPDEDQIIQTAFGPITIPSDQIVTPDIKEEQERQAFEKNIPLQVKLAGEVERAKTMGQMPQWIYQGRLKAEEAEANRQNHLEGIKLTNEGRNAAARISAAARITAGKMGSKVDPNVIADNTILAATGGMDVTGVAPNALTIRSNLKQVGMIPFGTKDAEKLKAVHDVDNLFFDTIQFIKKGMPQGQAGAVGAKIGAAIPATDLQNFRAMIKGRAGNISHVYGGEIGRLSDPDIERAMGLLVIPGITFKQALERLDSLKRETTNKVMLHILGGQPNHQKLLNLRKYEFDPAEFNNPVPMGDKLVRPFKKNPSNGEWLFFNPKTKTHDSMD